MELSLIGLQNAGKSSLVNVLTTGSFHEDMIPTVRPAVHATHPAACSSAAAASQSPASSCNTGRQHMVYSKTGIHVMRMSCFTIQLSSGITARASGFRLRTPLLHPSVIKVWLQESDVQLKALMVTAQTHRNIFPAKSQPPYKLYCCIEPQVGFNMRKVTKGGVTIKMWDLGGQVRGKQCQHNHQMPCRNSSTS